MDSVSPRHRVTAILGPTNTGKTHFAITRMLAHRSGMIGLPLRLLAREVYDRIAGQRGPAEVALITGEEKILPKGARFYVCTVEAMPLDIPVACLVIDEIQLCADPERGHVFTDRLLNARGEEETLLLGSDTMRGIIQRFIPRCWFTVRPRLSDLAYAGSRKLTRLPRRSAIVGFSAEDVYGIAEIIRRQRGGAAVVLGALSPRARNAQVELYQSGEVDFLVASDAIGMGLNMDVDHVAFAAREKFDGARLRPLRADEIGQIAGRAGRFRNDGTFGVTGDCEPFEEDLIARVESHRYEPVRALQWRNSELDFHTLPRLLASLEAPPPAIDGSTRGLMRARPASDAVALRILAGDDQIAAIATGRDRVTKLWEVCQLPDFRKLSSDEHVRLVRAIYLFLTGAGGVIPDDWLARQIARADVTEGDVATLSGRLMMIRTFTYAAHRPGWTTGGGHWQGITRAVEDRLSDALHLALTRRFIDARASALIRHMRGGEDAPLTLDEAGGVAIGTEAIGRLDGLRFVADPRTAGMAGRAIHAAARPGLAREIAARCAALAAASDNAITLSEHGKLWWEGAIVAKLARGASPLAPDIRMVADAHTDTDAPEQRLRAWLEGRVHTSLAPLAALGRAARARTGSDGAFTGPQAGAARGLAHQLAESFGALDRSALALPDRLGPLIATLRPFGVWFGRRHVYLPRLLRPDAARLLTLLWGIWHGREVLPAPPAAGLTSFVIDKGNDLHALRAGGFAVLARRAIRFDMLERLEDTLEQAQIAGADADSVLTKVVSLLGAGKEEGAAVLAALGWHIVETKGTPAQVWRRKAEHKARRKSHPATRHVATRHAAIGQAATGQAAAPRPDSPFAELARLVKRP